MGKQRRGPSSSLEELDEVFSVKNLRLFVELIERLRELPSVNAAAEAMGPSRSRVHEVLTAMARQYGRNLIDRKQKKLTIDGQAVYDWARRVLDEHTRGLQLPIGGREQIVLGVTGMVDTFMLPRSIAGFLREHKGSIDFRVRVGDIDELLAELHRGLLHAAICGGSESSLPKHLLAEELWGDIPTVMIAAAESEPWGKLNTWHDRRGEVRLTDLRKEIVCVLDADLRGVLADLPPPTVGGGRICVDRYAAMLSIVQAAAAVGFVPLLDKSQARRREYPGLNGLHMYRIAESDAVPTRKVFIWRRKAVDLPVVVARFLAHTSHNIQE